MTSKSLMAKAKKTPTLEKRLLAYSAVATAALLTSQPAEAAIQLTTSGATISGSTLAITFGGNTKFTIRQGLTAALNYQAVGIIKGSTGAFWAGGTVQPFGVPYSYAKAFNAGVSVKTQTPGYQGGFPYSSGNMAYTNKGQFNNVNNKYLGVKFKIGANTHYGWILVSCPNPTATSVTVHKWAYNDTPDGAILTGQEPPANAVPTVTVNNGAYTEDAGPTVIDSAATANDADGDGDWDTGAKLEVQITTNAEAADEISIDTSGNFSIATPNLSYSGVGVIGTISEASGTANDGTVT
ncbi:MAG: hypothetical protein KJ950_10430, partial [Proteobacteria bacterium]|nr:hypothetical protein [Pseudomonadota bacterium]MBU1685717.1 hypothetical protein [Pseudomonadota bacterium]